MDKVQPSTPHTVTMRLGEIQFQHTTKYKQGAYFQHVAFESLHVCDMIIFINLGTTTTSQSNCHRTLSTLHLKLTITRLTPPTLLFICIPYVRPTRSRVSFVFYTSGCKSLCIWSVPMDGFALSIEWCALYKIYHYLKFSCSLHLQWPCIWRISCLYLKTNKHTYQLKLGILGCVTIFKYEFVKLVHPI